MDHGIGMHGMQAQLVSWPRPATVAVHVPQQHSNNAACRYAARGATQLAEDLCWRLHACTAGRSRGCTGAR